MLAANRLAQYKVSLMKDNDNSINPNLAMYISEWKQT